MLWVLPWRKKGSMISNQEDAALVAAMARQAIADGAVLEMLADAGCTEAEAVRMTRGGK